MPINKANLLLPLVRQKQEAFNAHNNWGVFLLIGSCNKTDHMAGGPRRGWVEFVTMLSPRVLERKGLGLEVAGGWAHGNITQSWKNMCSTILDLWILNI